MVFTLLLVPIAAVLIVINERRKALVTNGDRE
jgi:hypothetical protein